MKRYIYLTLALIGLGYTVYITYFIVKKNNTQSQVSTTTPSTVDTQAIASTTPNTTATSTPSITHGVSLVTTYSADARLFYSESSADPIITKLLILSHGDLVYEIHNSQEKKSTIFYNGKVIGNVDRVLSFKEIGGKLAYLSYSSSTRQYTLTYDGKDINNIAYDSMVEQNQYIPDYSYMDIGGMLAYRTHDPTNKEHILFYDGRKIANASNIEYKAVDNKLAYTAYSKSTGKETLFYDEKKIASADSIKIKEVVAVKGKLSYVTHSKETNKDTLMLDTKVIDSATSIIDCKVVGDTIAYTKVNESLNHILMYDNQELASGGAGDFSYESINGQLAYYVMEKRPNSQGQYMYNLYYSNKKIDSVAAVSLLKDVDGKLLDFRRKTPTSDNISVYYDNKLLKDVYIPDGDSFTQIGGIMVYNSVTSDGVDEQGRTMVSAHFNYGDNNAVTANFISKSVHDNNATSSPYYFYAATKQKEGMLFSIYKVQ